MKRIAAGEVIERPASVAKELLENSLDAGATNISLMIQNAGLDLIQVKDNGEGMTEEDALLCTKRHATSKIQHADDLESIHSFGFRGEALASIGSVARMQIVTCTAEQETAIVVSIEDGEIRDVSQTASPTGTAISVFNLFGSVPARRKFLKSPATELRQAMAVFRRMALSYPQINFDLYVDNEITMDLRKTELENRVREVLGRDKFGLVLPFEKEFGSIKIFGYASRPGEFRRTRDDQFFFLNHRYIISRSLIHAVTSAYGPRLGRGEYPAYLVFIEMDAKSYDVNVHPTKIEVRFRDEKYVHDAVHRAVSEALRTRQSVPEFNLVRTRQETSRYTYPHRPKTDDTGQLSLEVQQPLDSMEPAISHQNHPEASAQFWQIHNRYILSQIKSGLTIIDQHVAHERILYEKALWARELRGASSQQLMFPQTIQLSPEDMIVLTEILSHLEKIGFGIREFGGNTIVVDSIPTEVKPGRETEVVIEILEEYKENRTKTHDTWEAVAASYACKAAVKSGDPLTQHEMAALIDQLFATKDPYFCPHGRPIVFNLSLEDIDKRFGR
ncbi:DNA mismatch repair endonuclease MutL [bacterium]|nr:DNA mismatch repair endonuclease MutL [bacterium]